MNYTDVEHITANAKPLKNCPGYSIDRDVPKEIADARKRLWGLYKDTKRDNPNVSVRIVNPAKLMCGNRVVQDEFKDWHAVLNQSRLVEFPLLDTNDVDVDVVVSTDRVSSASETESTFVQPTITRHALVTTQKRVPYLIAPSVMTQRRAYLHCSVT